MDISIRKEETADESHDDFTVTINGNNIVQTIVSYGEDSVTQWIHDVQHIYGRKRGNKNFVVALFVEFTNWQHEKQIDKLQLYVGSHCLLINPGSYGRRGGYGARMTGLTALQSFFSNPRITFVGLGIDSIVKVLEDTNVHAAKTIDLCTLVEQALSRDNLSRYDVEKLAKLVLGDMYGTERPNRKLKWHLGWNEYHGPINQRKVLFSTFDGFLSYQTAIKCMELKLKNSCTESKNACLKSS